MNNLVKHVGVALGWGWVLAAPVWASPPDEKVNCTQAPRSEWLSEARIREIFGEKDFTVVTLKVSHGNCYEFYAVSHDNSIVEAYYHPVTGEAVRYNRVTMEAAAPHYQSHASAPAR